MTPPPAAIAEEASNDQLLSQSWPAGSFATGTQFQPAVIVGSESAWFQRIPGHLSGFHIEHVSSGFPESVSSQVLFAPEPVPVPSSESTGPYVEAARWIEPIAERLDELVALPCDWDHHGAAPVDPSDLLSAFRFLRDVMLPNTPPPAVVPISGGGIQLEWHRAGFDVEVLVADGGTEDLYFCEIASGREWEGPAEAGFAEHNLAERLAD